MTVTDNERVIRAFTEEQVARLTGLSERQLRYWDRTGFFRPAFGEENRRVAYSRVYSFKDVCALRVIAALRKQHRVPLTHLRKVANELSHLADAKWTSCELFVLNRRVVFVEPGTQRYREIVSKQYVAPGLPLGEVVAGVRHDIAHLNRRGSDERGRIEKIRNVQGSVPVVAGTRIPVRTIRHFHEDGYSVDDILAEYPSLSKADVDAALRYKDETAAA
jgi:uncharacterized protein (DUF433 family)